MIQLLVTGKSGRMGQAVLQAASQEPAVTVAATHDAGENLAAALAQANTVIDFTMHKFTGELLEAALKNGTHLVIGTTGHTDDERAAIREASTKLPIVYAPNYSIGVNTLFWLTRKAAQILTQDRFDIEVTEMHHRHKIDAPSGTARELAEALADIRQPATSRPVSEVSGVPGTRGAAVGAGEGVQVHAVRLPSFVLSCEALFGLPDERLTIRHDAGSSAAPYVGGTLLAIRRVGAFKGLVRGLDALME